MKLLDRLRRRFKDKAYRRSYVESFLDSTLATQIRVLREQRHLTQEQLAELADVRQSQICRWENVNNSSWQIRTLKNLARAMDLVLVVKFESFGRVIPDIESFGRESLERPSFEEDPVFSTAIRQIPEGAVLVELGNPAYRAAGIGTRSAHIVVPIAAATTFTLADCRRVA